MRVSWLGHVLEVDVEHSCPISWLGHARSNEVILSQLVVPVRVDMFLPTGPGFAEQIVYVPLEGLKVSIDDVTRTLEGVRRHEGSSDKE